jgi:hypothetical protein
MKMTKIGGFARFKRQLMSNISTCIITCEKCIYGSNWLNAEMGDLKSLTIIKNICYQNQVIQENKRWGREN